MEVDVKGDYYDAWLNWHSSTVEYHAELERLIQSPFVSTQQLERIRAKMDANYQVFLKRTEEIAIIRQGHHQTDTAA